MEARYKIGATNHKEDERCEQLLARLAPHWADDLRQPGALEFTVGQIYGRSKRDRSSRKRKPDKAKSRSLAANA